MTRHPILRFAAAAVFLAFGAYMIAALAETALRPATVTARMSTVTETLFAEGRILREETALSLPADPVSFTVKAGERVPAGTLLGIGKNGERITAPCAGFFAGDRIVQGGWCFEADMQDTGSLHEGTGLTLVIAEGEYPATVTALDGGHLVIRCRRGLCDVLELSFAEAELRLGSVTGIRLPESAVREDENGFYVTVLKAGREAKQSVRILYRNNDCILADPSGLGEGVRILTAPPTG